MVEAIAETTVVCRVFVAGLARFQALRDITCKIAAGDRIAIVGPSGCGKSTLLHILAGLDRPSSGIVDWPALGKPDVLGPPGIAVVFQSPSLLPMLTVLENLALPMLLADDEAGAETAARNALHEATDEWASAEYRMNVAATLANRCLGSIQ